MPLVTSTEGMPVKKESLSVNDEVWPEDDGDNEFECAVSCTGENVSIFISCILRCPVAAQWEGSGDTSVVNREAMY